MYNKKRRRWLAFMGKRGIAVLLTLSMLFSFAPTVIAEGTELIEEVITNIIPETPEEVTVLSEITEMRDEFSKTFLMSYGTYTQVSYASPVHFEDENGVFQEIDNRLSVNAMTGKVTTGNGGTDVAFSQSQPQVSINANGHNISWNVSKKSELRNDDNVSLMNISPSYAPFTANAVNVADTQDFKALPEEEKLMSAHKAFSEMKYTSLEEGYAVNYTVSPGRVKEDILITSAENNEFVITVNAMGLTAVLGDYRTVIFKNKANETVLTFDVPYMYDANDEFSTDIDIALTKIIGGYEITLTADEEWLNDEGRVYPVVIDPVYTVSGESNVVDTSVHYMGMPGTCTCGANHSTAPTMLVGSEGGITSYGLIRFNSFTGYGLSKIISATITLTASGSNLSLNETFSLQRIENAGWDENVSYNTVNSFDCASPNERTSLTIKSNGSCVADYDVKEDVVGIIMGEYANYGYRLSYSGGFINFASSETDVAGSRPVITIEYEMESFANDTYYINSKGYYTFMSTGDTGYYPSTEKYNVDPLSENSGIMWEITSVGTNDAHCIIRPVGYASYALSDPNNEEGKPIFESLSPTATATASSRFKWLIFEYEEGIYYIKNKATGMILRCGGIGGDSIYVTPAQNVDNCKWRIMTEDEYNPRMFGELDPIKLELEESYNLSDIELPIAGTTFAEESEPYLISASIGCLDISADYSTITARSYGVARFTMGFRDNTSQISVYFLIPEYDGTYFIKNVASDLCLDVEAGGDKAMQQNYDQNSPPVWQIEMQTDGYYTIKDVESGRFLKVSGDSSAENQVVKVQSSAAMSAGYRFKIFTTADGFYKIVPKTNTNLTLAISATNTSEGNVIRQITYTANDDYKDEWRVIPNIYGTQDFRQLDESEYTEINCHGYAMMRNDKPDDWLPATHMTVSGYFASNSDYEQYTDIVALSTKQEFESWLRNVYGTDYYDYEGVITNNFDYTPLMHNQYRVVLRIGLGLVNKENKFDYHFWYQTYDGRWANKHGFEEDSEPELLNYNVTPCTENTDGWAIGDAYPNFYDSPIHSFIITIPESEVE